MLIDSFVFFWWGGANLNLMLLFASFFLGFIEILMCSSFAFEILFIFWPLLAVCNSYVTVLFMNVAKRKSFQFMCFTSLFGLRKNFIQLFSFNFPPNMFKTDFGYVYICLV